MGDVHGRADSGEADHKVADALSSAYSGNWIGFGRYLPEQGSAVPNKVSCIDGRVRLPSGALRDGLL